MRLPTALILCALVAGAAALPSKGLLSRRALRQWPVPEEPELIFGEPVQYMNFENVCDDTGVDFRLRFSFDGDFPWFSPEVTSVLPGVFVDYFCDNIGTVNYQFEGPDNRLNDTAVQEAIASGTCFNEQVMLRWPSWQGHGPQAELGLEFPNGTVSTMWLALNQEQQDSPIAVSDAAGILGSGWRTADGTEECAAGQEGCLEWFQVDLDSPKPTVTFECAAKPAQKKKGSSKGGN